MQVTAQLNNLRQSPRKVRLVSGLIKGMDVVVAGYQLDHLIKKSSRPMRKLLDSAVANAEKNFNLVKDNLYIKEVIVNEGQKLKRYRAKGFGSSSPIEKKTSRIKIVLDERIPGLKTSEQKFVKTPEKEQKTAEEPNEIKVEEKNEEKSLEIKKNKPEIKKEIKKKAPLVQAGRSAQAGLFGKLGKKFFRRKAV